MLILSGVIIFLIMDFVDVFFQITASVHIQFRILLQIIHMELFCYQCPDSMSYV